MLPVSNFVLRFELTQYLLQFIDAPSGDNERFVIVRVGDEWLDRGLSCTARKQTTILQENKDHNSRRKERESDFRGCAHEAQH